VQRKFKIAKFLPRQLVEFWCLHWPPIIVSKITEFQNLTGWLIGIPMTAKQMLENREKAKKKILNAVKKAEKLGAKIIGLGALTSPITNGGLDLKNKCKLHLTNGNTITARVSFEQTKNIINKKNQVQKIGVVGATGSTGQTILKLLVKKFPEKEYLLFARTKENLKKLINDIQKTKPELKISAHTNDLSQAKTADLLIITTAAAEALIKEKNLKQNAVVYDITQPKNLDESILKTRPDVKIIDGGLVYINDIKNNLPFGLPPKTVFACFAETLLLAAEDCKINIQECRSEIGKVHLTGKTSPQIAKKLWPLFKKYNFKIK